MWWHNSEALQALAADFVVGDLQRLGLREAMESKSAVDAANQALRNPAEAGMASLPWLDMATRFSHCMGMDRTGLSDLLLARRSLKGWTEVLWHSLERDCAQIGFHSSGSTGDPRSHQHRLEDLVRETRYFAERLPQSARVVSLVPSHHIYGFLWTILLPEQLGCDTRRLSPGVTSMDSISRSLRSDDVVIATPDLWSRLLEQPTRLPDPFTAVSSTAPLPAETAALLLESHPGARLWEIYGSTETAAIGWREGGGQEWHLLPWWQLDTADEDGTVAALLDRDHGHTVTLPDRLQQSGEQRFRLRGRRDTVVQIAGHNVDLARVAERLRAHPDIRRAAVRPGQDSLRYFLQVDPPPDTPENWCGQLQQWLQDNMADVPAASSIIVGRSLPVNPLGKPADWRADEYPVITGRFRRGWTV